MPKRIIDWLDELPDGIRENAIKNASQYPFLNNVLNQFENRLSDAVLHAFEWDATDEGAFFWQQQYTLITKVNR